GTLRVAGLALLGGSHAAHFHGPVAAAKGGDRIVFGIGSGKLVRGTAIQVQLQLAQAGLGNYNRTFRHGDARATFSSGFRQKYAVPVSPASGDIVDVEDHVREALIEDARLYLKRDL